MTGISGGTSGSMDSDSDSAIFICDVRYLCKRGWYADGASTPMGSIANFEFFFGGKSSVQLVRLTGKLHPVPPSGTVLIPCAALFNREEDVVTILENW